MKIDRLKKAIMNTYTLNLQAPWEEVKERLKENNIALSEEDLAYEPGQEDALLERLQHKMNKDKQAIKEYIESISSNTDKAG